MRNILKTFVLALCLLVNGVGANAAGLEEGLLEHSDNNRPNNWRASCAEGLGACVEGLGTCAGALDLCLPGITYTYHTASTYLSHVTFAQFLGCFGGLSCLAGTSYATLYYYNRDRQ